MQVQNKKKNTPGFINTELESDSESDVETDLESDRQLMIKFNS